MITEHLVRFDRAYSFKNLAVDQGCVYLNMTELINKKLMSCVLDVPEEKRELVHEMAFMTHISNQEFQKYYDKIS